ncbi:hypothetical protein B0E43_08285 [Algoriphagus sp. A40]|nr:hypothetical protein B0E43_08285 [Algoriphagus sp. A40]
MNYGILPVLIRPRPRGKGINKRGIAGKLYAGSSWPHGGCRATLVHNSGTPFLCQKKNQIFF